MELWAFKAAKYEEESPFQSYRDVYATIDAIRAGDVPWQCFTVSPQEDVTSDAPVWKKHEYQVWYRDPETIIKNMLDSPDFDGQFDYTPYIQYDKDGQRQWKNFMSGNYAWRKSVSQLILLLHMLWLIWLNDLRTKSVLKTPTPLTVRCIAVSSSVATRPQCQSLQAMLNTIRCIFLLGILTTPSAVPTGMQ